MQLQLRSIQCCVALSLTWLEASSPFHLFSCHASRLAGEAWWLGVAVYRIGQEGGVSRLRIILGHRGWILQDR